jgi:hypothetical protein
MVVGVEARYYLGRANNIGANNLAGKAKDVEYKDPL